MHMSRKRVPPKAAERLVTCSLFVEVVLDPQMDILPKCKC